jgi:CheY-like chemotaxis protein
MSESRYSILVVDPDPGMRKLVRQALLPEGFLVLEIAEVSEAMETSKAIVFDLLLADPFMPFVWDLTVRMADANPHLKVIFLSDYSPERVQKLGVCPSRSYLLQKTVKEMDLAVRVKEALATDTPWKLVSAGWHGPRQRQPSSNREW